MKAKKHKTSDPSRDIAPAPVSAKIVITGAPRAGTTAFIGTVSDFIASTPPYAEPDRSAPTDGPHAGCPNAHATTVMDVGRITLAQDLVLLLFGITGAGVLRDEVAQGAAGAVILIAPGHESAGLAAIDYFDKYAIPYVVAVPVTDHETAPHKDLRAELRLPDRTVITATDVHARESARAVLTTLITHALADRAHRPTPTV
ncbi:hypothetical protein ABZS94_34805 [Streptomyces sp. NPDC005500]|uniref:hypothetical protein n=1 Tax=Streptomyces sp. NPDC005500 TaxID=3155007 RepID=UPI0033AE31EE